MKKFRDEKTAIRFLGLLGLIVTLILTVTIFSLKDLTQKKEIGYESKSRQSTIKGNKSSSEIVINNENVDSKSSEKSGAIFNEKLPWENDAEFLKVKEECNANIRMGAFKTVLPDPLPGEEENVIIAAAKIAGTIIKPGETFSQNAKAGPYTTSKGYQIGPTYSGSNLITTIGGGVCKIASTLYNVAILSNMGIVERHNHSMIVPYVPLGQDATVYYGSKDIKIKNNYDWPVLLWAKGVGNVLYMAIYGRENPPQITWYHQIIDEQDTYNIVKHNSSLPRGNRKVIYEGYKGYTVKSWIKIQMGDGTEKIKHFGTDYYTPMPGLIEKGTKE